MKLTCPECQYKWTSHKKQPARFCSPMCEYRWYLRDRAYAMLDAQRRIDALEFTREYIKSITA